MKIIFPLQKPYEGCINIQASVRKAWLHPPGTTLPAVANNIATSGESEYPSLYTLYAFVMHGKYWPASKVSSYAYFFKRSQYQRTQIFR